MPRQPPHTPARVARPRRAPVPSSPTCGRRPVLPHAVGEGSPAVAVALRVHRGDGGRPLARGQTRRRGLGLAAVGPGSDLWLPPSSCKEKHPLVTRLVVTGFSGVGDGVRVPSASLFRSFAKMARGRRKARLGPTAARRGMARGQVGAAAGGGFCPLLGCSALWLMPPTVPWRDLGQEQPCGFGPFPAGSAPEPARGSAHKRGS